MSGIDRQDEAGISGSVRLDKLFGIRASMANNMSSMAMMLQRERLRGGGIEQASDSELETLRNASETLASRINLYLAVKGEQ